METISGSYEQEAGGLAPYLRLSEDFSVLDGEALSGAEGELGVLGERGGDLRRKAESRHMRATNERGGDDDAKEARRNSRQ